MSLQEIEKELFKDKKFKKYFEQNKRSHEIAVSIIKARISRGLSQEDLAKKVGTKQPSIARLERGSYLPSLRFLEKIAKALDTELIAPKFKLLEDKNKTANIEIKHALVFNHIITTESHPVETKLKFTTI